MRRTVMRLLTDGGGLISFTGVSGDIVCGDRREPVCDIGLELLNGGIQDLVDIASFLSKKYSLLLEARTVYERGMTFCGMASGNEESRGGPPVDRHAKAVDEFRKILGYHLQEAIRAQGLLLERPDERERIHRLRVAIRRFRSILSFLSPALDPEEYGKRQDSARRLGQAFSPLRDLDVLIETWEGILTGRPENPEKEPTLLASLQTERHRLSKEILAQVDNGFATAAFLNLWGWLHGEEPIGPAAQADTSLDGFVSRRLRHWERRIRKGLGNLSTFDLTVVHALRIRCKKLRYVVESLAPILPAKEYRRRVDRLKDLQDLLGGMCDTQRGIEVLDTLVAERRSSHLQYQRGILTGYLQCRCAALFENLESRHPAL